MATPKKAPVKVNENGDYIDIFPETCSDVVHLPDREGTVESELEDLKSKVEKAQDTADEAAVLKVQETAPESPTENMIWVKP